ncbi:MAG: hypothetical protein WC418_04380 [Candidatus Omnitrophota bacterium]|jgi:hypothetical protein
MSDPQQDFLGMNNETRGSKWDVLPARATVEEKRDIFAHCKMVIKLPYSVVTRLIWRKILSDYKSMPQAGRYDAMQDVNQAVEQTVGYMPIIRKQRYYMPREF